MNRPAPLRANFPERVLVGGGMCTALLYSGQWVGAPESGFQKLLPVTGGGGPVLKSVCAGAPDCEYRGRGGLAAYAGQCRQRVPGPLHT